jgi:response regulator of citrate/malate metabolism
VLVTEIRTLARVRAEFLEMPGLRLTAAQVGRLCGLERTLCRTVLDALVDARFLRVSADGIYARPSDGEIPRPRPAKAEQTQDGDDEPLRNTA